MANKTVKKDETAIITKDYGIFDVLPESQECEKIRYTTTTDSKRLFNALNSPSKKIRDYIGETFNVVDIVVTTSTMHEIKDDEKSPMVKRPCVHLFTDLGEHISSLSNGICRSILSIIEVGIIPTNDSPLSMKVVTGESKKGTFHSIELV